MIKSKRRLLMLNILAILLGILFLIPLVFVCMNSLKTNGEIISGFFNWLPSGAHFENYVEVWEEMDYLRVFLNTLVLTVFSTLGAVIFGSMAAYKMCRTHTKYSRFSFLLCISPLLITFCSIMIAMVQVAKALHLLNSIPGLIVMYWGLLMPFTLFLYQGNFKTVPLEIEEAARIDGCGSYRAFVHVVFPLLKPVTATVCIINAMKVWNDFLTPNVLIGAKSINHTLVIAAERFKGGMGSNYALIITAFVMTSLPIIIFYLFMQKYIVAGIAAGAVKG